MKRNILIAALCLVAAMGVQAQVIVKQENKERIELGTDKLVKMVFDSYDEESNGDNILFVCQSGDSLIFDIDELYALGFAEDYDNVENVIAAGKAAILFDAAAAMVYIVNVADEEGTVCVFNVEGRLVKRAKGTALSVGDLEDGLYVVSYNGELNAKIMKK